MVSFFTQEFEASVIGVKLRLYEKLTKFEKNLPHVYIYLVNVQFMRKIFFQNMCASQKVRTLTMGIEFLP